MAVLACCADGNWTAAATWAVVDTTDIAGTDATYLDEEATSVVSNTETSNRAASGFTPGAITIDGIGLKLSNRTGTTGTFSVQLWNLTDLAVVAGTSVTINCSDFPAATSAAFDGGWIFFKFAAPVTLTAAKAYVISPVTSSASQISLFRSATNAANWSRYLRTTTTQAPAATNDLIIAGEWTAAATVAVRTVTMNETASTDYGGAPTAANSLLTPGLAVCNNGVLTWGTTAATNYYLKMSSSVIVYRVGTVNMGTTGTPMPRDSTAIWELDPAADGDYGWLVRGGTWNGQGLSRTSGKNIVSTKLNADTVSITGGLTSTILPMQNVAQSTMAAAGVDATGSIGFDSYGLTDNTSNTVHSVASNSLTSVNNTTQVMQIWLARGTGTNNRYVRIYLADTTPTDGFFADVDLQTGTIGACTAIGNGAATSSSIAAAGSGYICKIVGKVNTTGAETPRTYVYASNSSGGITYVGDTTQNVIFSHVQVWTQGAVPTDLTVVADTGWLAGDAIAIASTSRTAADCESGVMSANAGASTLTMHNYPVVQHSGTSPTQAEVILLTRNVRMRSATSTLMAYFRCDDGSVVDLDWVEFYYIGENATGKRGIEIFNGGTNAINLTINFCSIHDCEDMGFYVPTGLSGNTITNLVFSNNVGWNCATIAGPAWQLAGAFTHTNYTIDSNVLIRTGSGNGWTLTDVGGTFTINTVVGAAAQAFSLTESSGVIGTFSGNTGHSNGDSALGNTSALYGTITNFTFWRNSDAGIEFASGGEVIFDGMVGFGNLNGNVSFREGTFHLKSPVLNGDTTFSSTIGLSFPAAFAGKVARIIVDDGDFSTVAGIKTAHTAADISLAAQGTAEITLRNTKLGAATEVGSQSNLTSGGFISAQKLDQTAGNHKTWLRAGTLQTDATTFNVAAPSMLMTPNSASLKLESATFGNGFKKPVDSGGTVSISVYVRKSATYNGNQPRLIQKANPALGQSSDVVIDTMTAGVSTWEQLSGTSSTATGDDGIWEYVVDADGTVGAVNIDDFA